MVCAPNTCKRGVLNTSRIQNGARVNPIAFLVGSQVTDLIYVIVMAGIAARIRMIHDVATVKEVAMQNLAAKDPKHKALRDTESGSDGSSSGSYRSDRNDDTGIDTNSVGSRGSSQSGCVSASSLHSASTPHRAQASRRTGVVDGDAPMIPAKTRGASIIRRSTYGSNRPSRMDGAQKESTNKSTRSVRHTPSTQARAHHDGDSEWTAVIGTVGDRPGT